MEHSVLFLSNKNYLEPLRSSFFNLLSANFVVLHCNLCKTVYASMIETIPLAEGLLYY